MAASQQLDSATQMFRSMGERVQALAPVVGMVEGFRIAIDELLSDRSRQCSLDGGRWSQ